MLKKNNVSKINENLDPTKKNTDDLLMKEKTNVLKDQLIEEEKK